ncbi:MAG: biotin synthase BioB [Thermoleophilia bacterium]
MLTTEPRQGSRWHALADRALAGERIDRDDALAVLRAPDEELLDLLGAAYRVRRHFYGDTVKLNFLINAKSGICPEDCGYCSQSRVSTAEIPKYQLLSPEQIVEQADRAVELKASTCCIVISARRPSQRELAGVTDAVRQVKERHPGLKVCACLGLVDEDEARALADAGVERYNHNLNTAEEHYGSICSTHTYEDRVATVGAVAAAGISPCSGLIVGMGESDEQLVDVAFALNEVGAESIPVNFLIPIEGTPLGDAGRRGIDPRFGLKVLAMVRLVNPDREIRLSAGREVHFGSLQPLGLYPANAIFVADYLTEPGQPASEDLRMIEDLGFTVEALGTPIGPIAEPVSS